MQGARHAGNIVPEGRSSQRLRWVPGNAVRVYGAERLRGEDFFFFFVTRCGEVYRRVTVVCLKNLLDVPDRTSGSKMGKLLCFCFCFVFLIGVLCQSAIYFFVYLFFYYTP